jgi:hypothetical protein
MITFSSRLLSALEWLNDDNNPTRALLNKPVAS